MNLLVDAGLLKSLVDLYRLQKSDLIKLERFGELSATKLLNAIEGTKQAPLAKFITALGIRHVGAQTAVALADAFQSLEALRDATEEELLKIPDIGLTVSESILAYFADEDNLKQLDDFKALGVHPVYVNHDNAPLKGQSFVVTGTLTDLGREEAEDLLREKGATVTSSVTKNTTALIAGAKPGASKVTKAEKLGIKVISEVEFRELIK